MTFDDQTSSAPTDQPSDNTTLVEVLDGYKTAGFVTDFWAEESASVRCGECQSVLPATKLAIHSMRRLEGASDPADMATVVATSCPVCGAEGTMVLTYGPAASEVDSGVFSALADRRDDDTLPPDSPPNETPTATSAETFREPVAELAPTPDEERAADAAAADIDVDQIAEHFEQMTELGANVKGEGQVEPDARS